MINIYDGRTAFYQWDTNQRITGNGFKANDELHFFNMKQSNALVVRAYELGGKVVADVPNILLQSSYPITVYWMYIDSNGQYTRKEHTFKVNQRAKPDGYVYTETEVLNYAYLDDRLNKLEGDGLANAVADYLAENPIEAGATAEEAAQIEQNKQDIEKLTTAKLDADKLPEAIDIALAQAKASGEFNGADGQDGKDGVDGKDGYTPQKGIDYFDGKDGINGQDGADGYSPVKGVDYFDGEDGYTPQKGVDYFDGQDGKDGQDGQNGKDGTSVTVSSVSESTASGGTNVVTFSDGKKVNIKNGTNGTNGKDGVDGKTPVKGTDYFTAADKAEMVNAVIAALPVYTGEVL